MSSAAERAADAVIAAMQQAERDVGVWTRRDIEAALMADPDLLGALAIEAGWVPPDVTAADLSLDSPANWEQIDTILQRPPYRRQKDSEDLCDRLNREATDGCPAP